MQSFKWSRLVLTLILAVLCLHFTLVTAQLSSTGTLITDLSWSPDGQKIALGLGRWEQHDYFGVQYPILLCEPLNGTYIYESASRSTRYLDLNSGCSLTTVDFSPTGTEVAFTSNGIYGAMDVLTESIRLQVSAGVFYQSIEWNRDDRRVLVNQDLGAGVVSSNLIDGLEGFGQRDYPSLTLPFLYSTWSPDGASAASSTADGHIYVWNEGGLLSAFGEHASPVRRLVWNTATGLIASGDDSGRMLVWNPATREIVQELTGHTDAILSLDWRADGTQLVSTSLDQTMRVWNWPSGDGQIVRSGEMVSAVAYSPDGCELAYGGAVTDPNDVRIEIVPVESLLPPTLTPTPTATLTPTPTPTPTLTLTPSPTATPALLLPPRQSDRSCSE